MDIDGQLQQAGGPTPQGDVVQTWLGTARSATSAYRRNGSRTAGVTGRNGGRARVARALIVRSQIHADLCTDLAGRVGKQTSDLCLPVLFGAQNATICAPKLVITEELPATQLDSHAPLRDSAVANENWVPPAAGGLRCRRAGVSRCRGCRREGWQVHACGCVPSVVADRLWTVRGRQLGTCTPGPDRERRIGAVR
jgi:hypothetical protein